MTTNYDRSRAIGTHTMKDNKILLLLCCIVVFIMEDKLNIYFFICANNIFEIKNYYKLVFRAAFIVFTRVS